MRILAALLLVLCCLAVPAQAEPVYRFAGDRYAWGGMGSDVVKAIEKQRHPAKPVKRKVKRSKLRRHYQAAPLTLAQGFGREVSGALANIAGAYMGGNPTGWRSRWCGNFMRLVVRRAGLPDNPGGNLARNWARYGGRAGGPSPGSIGVMRSHVGIVLGRCPDGRILLRSGNHGRRVGDGCYAASRFIAFRVAT